MGRSSLEFISSTTSRLTKYSDGLLAFTLELMVGGEARVDYRLEFHGRYSHARAYVERLLVAARLQPEILHGELRMESGAPVAGLVIRAKESVAARP